MNLSHYSVNRNIDQIQSKIPYELVEQVRAYHLHTPDETIFNTLDYIGIDAICDTISQGALLYDVAIVLDLPVAVLDRWLKRSDGYMDQYNEARRLSAQSKIAKANALLMSVRPTDRDAMAVAKAKAKADHLKWEATRDDPEGYGDRVKHDSAQSAVQFNIHIGQERQSINLGTLVTEEQSNS